MNPLFYILFICNVIFCYGHSEQTPAPYNVTTIDEYEKGFAKTLEPKHLLNSKISHSPYNGFTDYTTTKPVTEVPPFKPYQHTYFTNINDGNKRVKTIQNKFKSDCELEFGTSRASRTVEIEVAKFIANNYCGFIGLCFNHSHNRKCTLIAEYKNVKKIRNCCGYLKVGSC